MRAMVAEAVAIAPMAMPAPAPALKSDADDALVELDVGGDVNVVLLVDGS